MISVEETFSHILAACTPLPAVRMPIHEAVGLTLAHPVTSAGAQPPFDASAMDGYAIRSCDATIGASLSVIGHSAAGQAYDGSIGPSQAVRIFTGGVVPMGADMILIQENVTPQGADRITINDVNAERFIRAAGSDFSANFTIDRGTTITPPILMLLAAMNVPYVQVARRPVVSIISTGDELMPVGSTPNADQIIASNHFGVAAMVRACGAVPRTLPLIPDDPAMLQQALELSASSDMVVFSGGASVGDHDLVAPALRAFGVDLHLHKISMRPGKPLMFGTKAHQIFFGLPGNPVSAFVCGRLFMTTALRAMMGQSATLPQTKMAPLNMSIGAGGPRTHFMRGKLEQDGTLTVFERQDSSLISILAEANVLIRQDIHSAAKTAGDEMPYISI